MFLINKMDNASKNLNVPVQPTIFTIQKQVNANAQKIYLMIQVKNVLVVKLQIIGIVYKKNVSNQYQFNLFLFLKCLFLQFKM